MASGPVDSAPGRAGSVATASAGATTLDLLVRRRRYLVDRRYQLRVGLLTGGIALVLLILLNLSLFFSARQSADSALSASPEVRRLVQSQDRVQLLLTLLGSGVFLVGVMLVSVLETHKTAGAAYQIEGVVARLREGRLGNRVRLRRGDNLQGVAQAVNSLAEALHERELREIEALEGLAERLDAIGPGPAGAEIAGDVRRRAAERRQHLP